ncbi:MAG: class I SAM-dependent methyltransferase [Thalassobaculum sp.]|uniref:class I SAM-dependent methyltransferase n=1 Tax=Thalassobaculum sp. TaxID=2022740 RepID=UPI0032EA9996
MTPGSLDGAMINRPFLNFYMSQRISPVRQDISNLTAHYRRRGALYHSLGLPPITLRGRRVLELGPGTGENALATLSYEPAELTLVDGNPSSLGACRRNLSPHLGGGTKIRFIRSLIEDFQIDARYDVVLCEGVIPFQVDPVTFARSLSRYVAPGGVLVVTCIDGVQFIGEVARRLIADSLIPFDTPARRRHDALQPVFAPHLDSLSGMTRSHTDWIYDNLLIPYTGRLFGIQDAIEALGEEFDVFGASPNFGVDWRWYKTLTGEDPGFNSVFLDQYRKNIMNFLDYRVVMPPQDEDVGARVLALADDLFDTTVDMETRGTNDRLPHVLQILDEITRFATEDNAVTRKSLEELSAFLSNPSLSSAIGGLPTFTGFFGRGQQYLSFVRRTEHP